MAFAGKKVPDGYVVRTFSTKVTSTPGQYHRALALLESGGDAWAWCIDRFHARIKAGLPNANSLGELWVDQSAHGPFGELLSDSAQDVIKLWSTSFFAVIQRRSAGEHAGLPLKKRHLQPITWRKGRFKLAPATISTRARVTLGTARGCPPLCLRLARDHPYDPNLVRAVRLTSEAGELFCEVTVWVAVIQAHTIPGTVAGVDPGIIHPLVVATTGEALVVSGRAVRAEEFLHLQDSKARDKVKSTKSSPRRARPSTPRVAGSRRWRKIAARQRAAAAKNRRIAEQASNRAANLVAEHCVDAGVSLVAVGNPTGIEKLKAGRRHNRRIHRWGRAHARDALRYRLEECGVVCQPVDERDTSSKCPSCRAPAIKSGRKLKCTNQQCMKVHHRDVAGAQNMVTKLGHAPIEIARQEHRRVGTPVRRDRRRVLYEQRGRPSLSLSPSRGKPSVPARTRAAVGQPAESLA
jgi:putative transposase